VRLSQGSHKRSALEHRNVGGGQPISRRATEVRTSLWSRLLLWWYPRSGLLRIIGGGMTLKLVLHKSVLEFAFAVRAEPLTTRRTFKIVRCLPGIIHDCSQICQSRHFQRLRPVGRVQQCREASRLSV